MTSTGTTPRAILSFGSPGSDEVALAGGKGASLSRMAGAGLPVPPGFVVVAEGFSRFLDHHGGGDVVRAAIGRLDVHDQAALEAASGELRRFITANAMPGGLEEQIRTVYNAFGDRTVVAVRSSAVGEDSEEASFAGQQETFLNVGGADAVVRAIQECWASFFAPRALFYRAQKGVLADTRMAVVVQQMVFADKSGVMFTVDPVRRRHDRIVIEAVFGLGEGIVSGLITPDHYVIDRESGAPVEEIVAVQTEAIVRGGERGGTRHITLAEAEGGARVLSRAELGTLRRLAPALEQLFGGPQDVEWAIAADALFLLQSRPVTTC